MIFFNYKNNVIYINFVYNDFNLASDCFNALDTNLCCNCKLNFKLMFILSCNRLLQVSI